jgi:hypothetical protein
MLDNVILKGKDWTEAVYDAEAQIGTLLRE